MADINLDKNDMVVMTFTGMTIMMDIMIVHFLRPLGSMSLISLFKRLVKTTGNTMRSEFLLSQVTVSLSPLYDIAEVH